MDMFDFNPWLLGMLAVVAFLGFISQFVPRLGKDNPVEQVAEKIIKDETGISVDLSPSDKGKDSMN